MDVIYGLHKPSVSMWLLGIAFWKYFSCFYLPLVNYLQVGECHKLQSMELPLEADFKNVEFITVKRILKVSYKNWLVSIDGLTQL